MANVGRHRIAQDGSSAGSGTPLRVLGTTMVFPLLALLSLVLSACVLSNSSKDNGYPSLPLLPLPEFSAEVQQASAELAVMSGDSNIAVVAPLISPLIASPSVSVMSKATVPGFPSNGTYVYRLGGKQAGANGSGATVVLELTVGKFPPEAESINAASYKDIRFRLEPVLAPINLEPDGSAPIYRKDTASTMTLAFNGDFYFVALTVTDTCGSASDARLVGGGNCFSWDELQMFLDTLAVIDRDSLTEATAPDPGF